MITCSRHSFLENCPWEAVQEDHIQVDLADPDNTVGAIAVIKERLKEQSGRLNALIKQCGDLTQGGRRTQAAQHRDGSRLAEGFSGELLCPDHARPRIDRGTRGRIRGRSQYQLDRGLPRASFRWLLTQRQKLRSLR